MKVFRKMKYGNYIKITCSHSINLITKNPSLQLEAIVNIFMTIMEKNILIWQVVFQLYQLAIAIQDLIKYLLIKFRNYCIYPQFICTNTTANTLKTYASNQEMDLKLPTSATLEVRQMILLINQLGFILAARESMLLENHIMELLVMHIH